MSTDKTFDAITNFIEKWGFTCIVLTAYFFISYKIIHGVISPPPNTNGHDLVCVPFVPVLAHFMLALIAAFILSIRMSYGKNFTGRQFRLTFLAIAIPVLVTLISCQL